MNDTYKNLKQQYDDITKQISELYQKQNEIRDLMEDACTHENLIKVYSDPFLVSIDVEDEDEDEETKYKCTDCFRYFTQDEVDKMK